MADNEAQRANGTVVEALPNDMYRVELDSGGLVKAHVPGTVKVHLVRIVPGDRVAVEVSAYDGSRGRVVARFDE